MGKPRDIGIRENSVNQLNLALELIEEHKKSNSNLKVASTLIKTTITHLNLYPEDCEFRDGCREDWESENNSEPYNWRDDRD